MLGYGNYNCINFCEMGVSIGAHAKCSRLSNKEKLFDILQCFFVKLFSNPQSKAIILVCDKKSYCRCVIVCVVECSWWYEMTLPSEWFWQQIPILMVNWCNQHPYLFVQMTKYYLRSIYYNGIMLYDTYWYIIMHFCNLEFKIC